MTANRVLLVAENDDFLDGLASWLVSAPDLEVAGRAHSGLEAMERIQRIDPDLVLMDISLRDMNGLLVARWIKQRPRPPIVLLMTFHDRRAAAFVAREAGVDGCLTQAQITKGLLPAIQEAFRARGGRPATEAATGRDSKNGKHHTQ